MPWPLSFRARDRRFRRGCRHPILALQAGSAPRGGKRGAEGVREGLCGPPGSGKRRPARARRAPGARRGRRPRPRPPRPPACTHCGLKRSSCARPDGGHLADHDLGAADGDLLERSRGAIVQLERNVDRQDVEPAEAGDRPCAEPPEEEAEHEPEAGDSRPSEAGIRAGRASGAAPASRKKSRRRSWRASSPLIYNHLRGSGGGGGKRWMCRLKADAPAERCAID